MSMGAGSGGVSVRAGPSPRLDGGRRMLRQLQRYYSRGEREAGATSTIVGCALVCSACGQLAWSTEDDAEHPHRREHSVALRKAPKCSHCGETAWVDLQQEETALALRQWEAHADDHRRKALVGVYGAGLLTVGIGVALVGFLAIEGFWALLVPVAMLGLAASLATVRHFRFAMEERRVMPRRWAMALPPAAEPSTIATGPITADARLRAPLTGRTCVAYEVGIRVDDDGEAPRHSWLLLEQHLESLAVDGHTVDPGRTHLEVARKRLGVRAELELDESAVVFLRQRGFGTESRSIVLFESILDVDDVVELRQTSDGAATIVV